ncbi:MAG: transglutaminase-like domain-containing protein [Clostridia bacterium]|nr:transglutaminase-like domain-containing protein [Clostridia bacterium]
MKGFRGTGRIVVALVLFAVLFVSCGSSMPDGKVFEIQEVKEATLDTENAEEVPIGKMDISSVNRGYVSLSLSHDGRIKFQVLKDTTTYTYDIPGDETETVVPLNMGDGTYLLRVLKGLGEDRFALCYSKEIEVVMDSEFEPFLRPSQYVYFTEDSECVKKARELTKNVKTDLDAVAKIYKYLTEHIKYDYEKAETVKSGYLPFPDDTLLTEKGICFDYASLACAMIRSIGIPCKLITGYLTEDRYHAWNTFYIEGKGWITVGIKTDGMKWERIDITRAASGATPDRLKDDSEYTTRYTY